MQDREQILMAISEAESVLLFTHIHSDGDCLGSSFGLAYFLCGQGKRVAIINEEAPPENLHFIYDEAARNENFSIPYFCVWNTDRCKALMNLNWDISVAIDVSDVKRLGERRGVFYQSNKTARIDHHLSEQSFTDLTMCNPEWAATAEGIWDMICTYKDYKKSPYIKEIAICIYAGILTDTGCFAYSNVTVRTHLIAAELMQIAGNMSWQYSEIYENQARSAIALKALAFGKIEYFYNGRIAYLHITREDMEKTNASYDDLSGFAPLLRCIENVSAGILVKPDKKAGQYRISLRSDEHCDVNAAAAEFGGGGHKRAAGLVYNEECGMDFERYKENLIGVIKKWMV